jgi:23S rRNA (guanine745-N1)-methyltransferase
MWVPCKDIRPVGKDGRVDLRIVARLRCPVCAAPLTGADASLVCASGHSFDVARQGYVDLSAGPVTHPGDTAEMVAARERVLAAGHFAFITAGLADATAAYDSGLIVDVGAGTGVHLKSLLETRPDALGLAVDVSKAALRRAARAHPRMGAVRADAWRGLPVADGAASVVLNVFAPRAGREFARVLRPGGRLAVVTPASDHLRELGLAIGVDPRKEERLFGTLGPWFVREKDHELRTTLRLSADDARAVAGMGPGAFHRAAPAYEGAVTAAVHLSVWRHGED